MKKIKVKYLKNSWEKILGLINSDEKRSVYFKTRFGIHTFGMKFPIDVIVLDRDKRVVKLSENMKPNRLLFWNPKYNNVVEMPFGEINKLNLKEGNIIKLVATSS